MKRILYLVGLLAMLATSGCVIRDDHPRGGVYDPYYRGHGYYYHGYDRDHYWYR